MQSALLDHSSKNMQGELTVEIALDPEVLKALYRRGRRRLRDIQTSSQAALKLDRLRGVLRATGSQESIADVQRQLESVSSSHLAVTAAVWAELMRTRAEPDMNQAAVARIQHESGCRIHIERSAQQVQLFGPADVSFLAQHLLEKLECLCIEEVVDMRCPMDPNFLQKLEGFAQDFGVTLQVTDMSITILGVKGAVFEAVKELQSSAFDSVYLDSSFDDAKPSDAAHMAIHMAMSNLTVDADKRMAATTMAPPSILQNAGSMQGPEISMRGAVTSKISTPNWRSSFQHQGSDVRDGGLQQVHSNCPTCGCGGKFCFNCGNPIAKMMRDSPAGCPTCGLAKFCGHCGQRTGNKMTENMGTLQHRPSGGASYSYDPAMFRGNSMPMMTMLPVQPTTQTTLQPMMQSAIQTAIQPGASPVNNPSSQQLLVPVSMCFPYDASCQQYLPLYAGA